MQHQARKRFGQNFLVDQNIIERIVRSINPLPGERLVEIGPGLGALTCPLLQQAGELDVIELDRDIIPKLSLNCGRLGKLRVHQSDVLDFDFGQLASGRNLRIVGNLPYNISTPIIFHLVEHAHLILDMHFMLQKEVVERLAAQPGGSEYGRLTIMAQLHFAITPLFLVPPQAFNPQPKVESAIVRLVPHATPPCELHSHETFAGLVRQAFSQRRKTLHNTLRNLCNDNMIRQAGIDPGQRAQELSLLQFARLSNLLHDTSGDKTTKADGEIG
ncbi:MAG: rRNA (adenine1518-N6/adenine1519-N6)-dimethyltransferase [Pseudomonadota bacterium]|nr:rRNA (adenine1518-N6/adenine1519-N6)-dimethyltransferase [Pseudomonadota bacterium]